MGLRILGRRKLALLVAAVTVCAFALRASPAASAQSGGSAADPTTATLVYNEDFPDPSVLVVGHTYFAYSTNSDGENVPVIESHDLVQWHAIGDVMSVLPLWATEGYIWSPSVSRAPSGGYQLFFSAYDESEGVMCLGRSTSASPFGPFVDISGAPFLCQSGAGGSIDPSVYQSDGTDYLVWKADGEGGQPQAILSARLTAGDSELAGAPVTLLTAALGWEDGVVERPAFLDADGVLHLYFSAGHWSSADYAIGTTTCASPMGPCEGGASQPVAIASDVASGAGSPTFFAADGRTYLAFSAWTDGIIGYEVGHRALFLMTIGTDQVVAHAEGS
jgi:beta-xylosidase